MTIFVNGDFTYITTSSNEATIGDETASDANAVGCNTNYNKDLYIPKTVSYNSLTYTITRIGQAAFGSTKSQIVFVPNTIKSMGMWAFELMYDVKSFIFEEGSKCTNIDAWGLRILSNTFRIIVIPTSIKKLGDFVFWERSATIDVYYCGAISLNPNMAESSLSYIRPHVSKYYPKTATFLRVEPVERNLNCPQIKCQHTRCNCVVSSKFRILTMILVLE